MELRKKFFKKYLKYGIVFPLLVCFLSGQAQEKKTIGTTTPVFAISSNLLYDATTSMNLGAEFKLSEFLTLKIPFSYNPWTFDHNQKFKFIFIQPELRLWICEPFSGSFFGLHAHYAFFNVGGVGTNYMQDYRYQGSLYGAGLSYGYQFYLAPRWSLEAGIGVGYAYMNYDVYYCETCGEFVKNESRNYFGPTHVGLSLIYFLK